jgi:rhamnosyltransferase
MTSNVEILLSIHKPNLLWLHELITSIQKQTIQPARLIIRLDGQFSIPEIPLESDFNIEVLENDIHVGFVESFFCLLQKSTADFVLFCDQDDVWLENKILNLLKAQADSIKPTITYCSFQVIDRDGLPLNYTHYIPKKITRFSFLFSNGIPGNTMMLNGAMVDLVKQSINLVGTPDWHDWWSLSIAREFGQILGSNSNDMKYRVHDNNVVGLQVGKLKKLITLLTSKQSTQWLRQAEMLLNFMKVTKVSRDGTQFLEELLLNSNKSRVKRFNFLLRNGILTSDPIDFLQAMRFYVLL